MSIRFCTSALVAGLASLISVDGVALECDLTGNWRNVTAGGDFQLSQSGDVINFMHHNDKFNHYGSGTYNVDDNSFLIRQNRVEKETGCRTQGNITFKVMSCNKLIATATWDGGCGVPPSEGPYTCVRE